MHKALQRRALNPFFWPVGPHFMHRFFRLFPRFALIASVVVFVVCLQNDGYYIEGPQPRAWADAWALLLLGWIGIGSGTIAWLANPALFLAWVFSLNKRPVPSLLSAIVALAFMVSFLVQQTVVTSEASTYSRIAGYGTGFWLWVVSAALQAVGSAVAAMPTEFLSSKENAIK